MHFFRSAPATPAPLSGLDPRALSILQRFKTYCDDYLRLERLAGPGRRLGLGDEPIRDIFALAELNGWRILRLPIPAASRLSGVFIFLEDREAAFALINSADTSGRQEESP